MKSRTEDKKQTWIRHAGYLALVLSNACTYYVVRNEAVVDLVRVIH